MDLAVAQAFEHERAVVFEGDEIHRASFFSSGFSQRMAAEAVTAEPAPAGQWLPESAGGPGPTPPAPGAGGDSFPPGGGGGLDLLRRASGGESCRLHSRKAPWPRGGRPAVWRNGRKDCRSAFSARRRSL